METLGVTELWFLDAGKLRRLRPSVFRSKKQLLLDALSAATADERLALGISYGRGYSQTSQSVHPLFGSHDYGAEQNDTSQLIRNFGQLSIILMHIMHLANLIAGEEDPEGIASVMGADFEKSAASETLSRLSKEFKTGDIVLTAWNDLAQVIEEQESQYGYRAFKIRYISTPPLPEYPEDWLESQGILIRLIAQANVRETYERAAQSSDFPKEVRDVMEKVLQLPDEELMDYAKDFFLDLFRRGALIPMLLNSGALKSRDVPDDYVYESQNGTSTK